MYQFSCHSILWWKWNFSDVFVDDGVNDYCLYGNNLVEVYVDGDGDDNNNLGRLHQME